MLWEWILYHPYNLYVPSNHMDMMIYYYEALQYQKNKTL